MLLKIFRRFWLRKPEIQMPAPAVARGCDHEWASFPVDWSGMRVTRVEPLVGHYAAAGFCLHCGQAAGERRP